MVRVCPFITIHSSLPPPTNWPGYVTSTTHLTVKIHHQPPHDGETLSPTSRWTTWYTLTTVSAGHGLHYNNMGKWSERETPLNMNRAIFDHLDSLFPAPGGSVIGEAGGNGKNGFVNGAQCGTGESSLCLESPSLSLNEVKREELMTSIGTDYFSMCFGEHISDEVDLVLIDMCMSTPLYYEMTNISSYQ